MHVLGVNVDEFIHCVLLSWWHYWVCVQFAQTERFWKMKAEFYDEQWHWGSVWPNWRGVTVKKKREKIIFLCCNFSLKKVPVLDCIEEEWCWKKRKKKKRKMEKIAPTLMWCWLSHNSHEMKIVGECLLYMDDGWRKKTCIIFWSILFELRTLRISPIWMVPSPVTTLEKDLPDLHINFSML